MTQKDILLLADCPVFRGISPQELASLLTDIPVTVKSYHKGSILRFQGDAYDYLLILLAGKVSAEIISLDGKKVIIETLKKTAALATGVLFATDDTLPVTIIADQDVRVACFSRKTVVQIFQMNSTVLMNFLRDAGDKILFLTEKIRLLTFDTISQKIAGYLLNLAQKQGTDSLNLPYSREQMAELFGVARPSLSRGFSEYYDRGILRSEGRIMHILDRQALRGILIS